MEPCEYKNSRMKSNSNWHQMLLLLNLGELCVSGFISGEIVFFGFIGPNVDTVYL